MAIPDPSISMPPGNWALKRFSRTSEQQTLPSLIVRYLLSVRTGPAIARAQCSDGLGRVEVINASNNALAVAATIRLFDE